MEGIHVYELYRIHCKKLCLVVGYEGKSGLIYSNLSATAEVVNDVSPKRTT